MTDTSAASKRRSRDWLSALLVAAAVVACLPYLALKVAWVAGSRVGGVPAEMGTTTYRVANLVTVALEVVVVALVAALASRWGQRAPAGLVLVPTWVGSGLLAPVTVGVPLGTVIQVVAGGSAVPVDAGLDHWVFALVYGGFVAQALILTAAFARYVRRRWPWVLRACPPGTSQTRQLQRTLLVLAVPAAVLHGCAFAVWAGAAGEPGGDPAAVETLAQRVTYGVRAVLPLVGAAATVMLVRRGTRPAVLVGAWVGSGYLFAAGLFGGPATTVGHLVDIVGVGSGLTLAMAGFLALPDPPPRSAPPEQQHVRG